MKTMHPFRQSIPFYPSLRMRERLSWVVSSVLESRDLRASMEIATDFGTSRIILSGENRYHERNSESIDGTSL
jgi:hypothetical protein